MDSRKCQTVTATPAKPGELPVGLVVGRVEGGAYNPALVMVPTVLLPPATVFTCHVTAVFERLATVAVNVVVLPKRTWLAPLTVTEGCGGLPPPELPLVLLVHPLTKRTMASSDTKAVRKWESRESCTRDLRNAGDPHRKRRGAGLGISAYINPRSEDSCAGC